VFGANLLPAAAADKELVELAASKARIVDFYEPPTRDLVDLVHARGALTCWQVGSRREALEAVETGCDIGVAQGIEAGGHVRGHRTALGVRSSLRPVVPRGGEELTPKDVRRHCLTQLGHKQGDRQAGCQEA
jgi:NAD(P)H-dependent flavin oxidoreductase YrpB (nitropropane dioxygenase family)